MAAAGVGSMLEVNGGISDKFPLERDAMRVQQVDHSQSVALSSSEPSTTHRPARQTQAWKPNLSADPSIQTSRSHSSDPKLEKELQLFNNPSPEGMGSTVVALIKACAELKDLKRGRNLHAYVERKRLLENNVFIGSSLVHMYSRCGSLGSAQEVFDKLQARDVVSWTALISGYAQYGHGKEALSRFELMKRDGICPNVVTYVCCLKACTSIGAIAMGQEIHAEIVRKGSLEHDIFVGTALVDMYSKCGWLTKAQEVFDRLQIRDIVSWNALISGYAQHEQGKEALRCFEQMQVEGISPNAATFTCSLKACGSIGDTDKGQKIHAQIARKGSLETDLLVGTALVDMYAKCGFLGKAQEVFDKLPVQDVVLWTALITRYVQHGQNEKALYCFDRMKIEGICPNSATFACSLKACGNIGAADKGEELHAEIARRGLLKSDLVIGTALVEMYSKCGWLMQAQEVFDELPVHDVILWNALITGYAQFGEAENVFCLFEKMLQEGVKPDLITFNFVLNACNHTGLVDKGKMYFESMSDFDIIPTIEHHTCMIDLLGRAGQLDKAMAIIKKMSIPVDPVVWQTLLSACRKWGNVDLGRQAFEHAACLDGNNPALYVCMYNTYSDAGKYDDAGEIEALQLKRQACKEPENISEMMPIMHSY